jgi:hypothetical protein
MPLSLPKQAAKMSRYHYLLCSDSISSEKELSKRSKKHKDLFRLMREARLLLSKAKKVDQSNGSSRSFESKCKEALILADEIGDKRRKSQVEELLLQLGQNI